MIGSFSVVALIHHVVGWFHVLFQSHSILHPRFETGKAQPICCIGVFSTTSEFPGYSLSKFDRMPRCGPMADRSCLDRTRPLFLSRNDGPEPWRIADHPGGFGLWIKDFDSDKLVGSCGDRLCLRHNGRCVRDIAGCGPHRLIPGTVITRLLSDNFSVLQYSETHVKQVVLLYGENRDRDDS